MGLGKYKVTWETTEKGKKLDKKKETIVKSVLPPKKGESRSLFSSPSTKETIIKVEDLHAEAKKDLPKEKGKSK